MPTKDVTLKVRTDTSQAQKGFKNLEGSVTKMSSSLKSMAASFGLAFGGIQLISFFKESTQLAMIQENAEKKLSVAYGKNIDNLKRYAAELQKQTAYGDEAIIEAQALISMFTKDEEAIKSLTKATLDLAAAKGMDLVTAADLLSKTIGSSTNALSRYGIEVKGVVGSSERLNSLMTNLNDKFGGQAQAALETYAGKISNVKNALSDMQEKVGEEFMPVQLTLLTWLKDTIEYFDKLQMSVVRAGIATKRFFGIDVHGEFSGMMASPHRENQNNGGISNIYRDPITGAITVNRNLSGMARRSQSGYGANRGTLDYDTNIIFRRMIESQREMFSKANIGGLLGLRGVEMPIKPEIMIDESELRESFREFDVIANESARTLFNAFSQVWNDIFGEANSLFEQLLQNISMGLFDLFAQDVSKSIFESLIPGGGLLSGLGDALGLGKRSSVLVQIGESQVQMATAKVVPNAIAEQQRRRILD